MLLVQPVVLPRAGSCQAGQRGELDVQGCEPCPLGTFQPSEGTMTCLGCAQGLTTLTQGSTEEYKCICEFIDKSMNGQVKICRGTYDALVYECVLFLFYF